MPVIVNIVYGVPMSGENVSDGMTYRDVSYREQSDMLEILPKQGNVPRKRPPIRTITTLRLSIHTVLGYPERTGFGPPEESVYADC